MSLVGSKKCMLYMSSMVTYALSRWIREFLYKHRSNMSFLKKSFGVRITLVRFFFAVFRYVIHEIFNFTPRKQHFHTPSPQLNVDTNVELFADWWSLDEFVLRWTCYKMSVFIFEAFIYVEHNVNIDLGVRGCDYVWKYVILHI